MARVILPPELTRLPNNWCWIELGKLVSLKTGYPFDSKHFITSKTLHTRPLIRIRDIVRGYTETYTDEACPNEYIIKKGEILIGMDGDFNVAKWQSEDALLNQRVCVIKSTSKLLLDEFLFYYLPNPLKRINDVTPSVTVKHLSTKTLEATPIAVPPVLEQQRIVDRIESLFAKLNEAKEKAQAALDSFETRKAAILHKAFTGELTAKWRKENNVILSGWETFTYSQLGNSKLGKMLDKAKNVGRPVAYLRNINVRWFSFDLDDLATMLASDDEISSLSVKQGDLFICEGGEPGRCAIWKDDNCDIIFQKALHRFRPNEKVIGSFLCYNLYFMSLNGTLEKYFTGTTIKHLTGQALAKIPIHLPSVAEQEMIVSILDSNFAKEQQAKETAENVLERINTLKKSILSRAFRGELGTNDPTEENAIELIKSLLSEKINADKPKPRRIKSTQEVDLIVKTIIQALSDGEKWTPEKLKITTRLEVDEFYDQLKKLIEDGKVTETRENGESYLEANYEN